MFNFGNRINYGKRGWTPVGEAAPQYRSHYKGWNCLCPNAWIAQRAVHEDGRTGTLWFYWAKDLRDMEDGGDWVRDWAKCNDIEVDDD